MLFKHDFDPQTVLYNAKLFTVTWLFMANHFRSDNLFISAITY